MRRIGLRLGASYAVVVVLLVVSWLVAVLAMSRVHASFEDTVVRQDGLTQQVFSMTKAMLDQETGLRGYFLSGRSVFLQPYRQGRHDFPVAYAQAQALTTDGPEVRQLAEVHHRALAWQIWAGTSLADWRSGQRAHIVTALNGGTGKKLFDRFRAAVDVSLGHLTHDREAALRDSTHIFDVATSTLGGIVVSGIVAVFVLGWLITRSIVQRLVRLREAATRIRRGYVEEPVIVQGRDEIAELAADMEVMREHLDVRGQVTELLATTLDLDRIYPDFARQLHRLFPFHRLSISLIDHQDQEMVMVYAQGVASDSIPTGQRQPLADAMTYRAVETGVPVIWNGETSTPADGRFWDERTGVAPGIRSFVLTPMRVKGSIIGTLNLSSLEPNAYDKAMAASVLQFAQPLANAIENSRLYAAVNQANAEMQQVQEELVHQLARSAAITTSMGDGLYVIDSAGRATSMNPAAEQMLGWTQDELRGKAVHDIIHVNGEAGPLAATCPLLNVLRAGEPIRVDNDVFTRKDGSLLPVAVTSSPIVGGQRVDGAVVTFRDITVAQQAEASLALARDQALEATRLKSEFLANMSHELRTPLNAIIGFSEILYDQTFGDLNERQQRYVGNVSESGLHLLALVNDVLDISKVEAGHMPLHLEDVDPGTAIRNIKEKMAPLAEKKDLSIRLNESQDNVLIRADRARFDQILYNLLSNAVKFTPSGGIITVGYIAGPKTVAIAIQDTGTGIAEEDLGRVFDQFEQVDSTTSRKQQGTGLGLALTRNLVRLQGGTVELRSSLGEGSTFTVTLPRARTESTPRGQRGTVMVIEDDDGAQELLRLALTDGGYGVEMVTRVEDIAERARSVKPEAITLDLMLEGELSWAALRELKADPITRAIPVVIVSFFDEQQVGWALGASGFLTKPVARQVLLETLQQVIPGDSGDGSEFCVLGVDDEPAALELIAAMLAGSPYRLITATSGEEALRLLGQERPDVVLVDLMMGPMDGFEVVERIVSDPALCAIPIIVLTGRDLTQEDLSRLNGDVVSTLSKNGFATEQLLRELRRVVTPDKEPEVMLDG